MDTNELALNGRLAAKPELREFESGARLLRMLVTVRTDAPRRRVDVLPVNLWDADDIDTLAALDAGSRVSVVASLQRRFWTSGNGRSSRVEIVASHVDAVPLPKAGCAKCGETDLPDIGHEPCNGPADGHTHQSHVDPAQDTSPPRCVICHKPVPARVSR